MSPEFQVPQANSWCARHLRQLDEMGAGKEILKLVAGKGSEEFKRFLE